MTKEDHDLANNVVRVALEAEQSSIMLDTVGMVVCRQRVLFSVVRHHYFPRSVQMYSDRAGGC